jgi:hypothetical protein
MAFRRLVELPQVLGYLEAPEPGQPTAEAEPSSEVVKSTNSSAIGFPFACAPRHCADCDAQRQLMIWDDDRARAVLVSSADRPFKGDEQTFDPARPNAALDFDGGDRLELPALSSMLVEHVLELVAGHLAADHALAELDHHVLVAVYHARTIVNVYGTNCCGIWSIARVRL